MISVMSPIEDQQANPDRATKARPGRPRGAKSIHVRLDLRTRYGLERAAAARGLEPEALLAAIGRVVIADRLIDAVLDGDQPADNLA